MVRVLDVNGVVMMRWFAWTILSNHTPSVMLSLPLVAVDNVDDEYDEDEDPTDATYNANVSDVILGVIDQTRSDRKNHGAACQRPTT